MDTELCFTIANLSVLPVWLLLAIAPRCRVTHLVADSCAIPLLLAVAYVTLLVMVVASGAALDFSSLEAVAALFQDERALLVGWIHYLAFDLFIGTWIVRDAQRVGIWHLAVLPCLLFTLMLGPTGLLLYFIVRCVRGEYVVPRGAMTA